MLMMNASLKWFTEETTINLVLARTIGNGLHHDKSPTRCEEDLNLLKT